MMRERSVCRLSRSYTLFFVAATAGVVACSSPSSPHQRLQLGASYHLRSVDGVPLPIVDSGGASLDSGHFLLRAPDTVRIDEITHAPPANGHPGLTTVGLATYRAIQSGPVVVLMPITASDVDTAIVSGTDTVTVRAHDAGKLQVRVFVAP